MYVCVQPPSTRNNKEQQGTTRNNKEKQGTTRNNKEQQGTTTTTTTTTTTNTHNKQHTTNEKHQTPTTNNHNNSSSNNNKHNQTQWQFDLWQTLLVSGIWRQTTLIISHHPLADSPIWILGVRLPSTQINVSLAEEMLNCHMIATGQGW